MTKRASLAYQYAEHLSTSRLADPYTGSDNTGFLLAALLGGLHTNFDATMLEDTVTPCTFVATVPNNGLANVYRVHCGGANLFVNTSAVVGAFTGAFAGCRQGGSNFKFSFADVNVAGADNIIALSQDNGTVSFKTVPTDKSFRLSMDFEAWNNRLLAKAKGFAQVGLMGNAHANFLTAMADGPQAAGQPACYVEFAAGKIRLVVNATASAWVELPANPAEFSISIEYKHGKGAFLYVGSKRVAFVTVALATGPLQVFARAGHLVGYTALTDTPFDLRLDAVSVAFDK